MRENPAGNDLDPARDDMPNTAFELQAMAELADAEAAAAEARAAGARARARAMRLRRLAEPAESSEPDGAQTVAAAGEPPTSRPDSVSAEMSLDKETKAAQPEEHLEESAGEHDGGVFSADAPPGAGSKKPARYRRWLRRRRLSTVATVLTIAVILASLAGTVFMITERHDASQQRERAAEFGAAARQGVLVLTSLDFNNAKWDVQRIIDNSTGSFKADIQKMADEFAKSVEESKVVEQGAVESVAVDLDSVTRDSAVVLVAAKSDVTNAAGAKQDPRDFRLIVTILRDGSQLKMSKVQFVP